MMTLADAKTAAHLLLVTFDEDAELQPCDLSLDEPMCFEQAFDCITEDDELLLNWPEDILFAIAEMMVVISRMGLAWNDRARLLAVLDPFVDLRQPSLFQAA